ncbi:MAG TPA: adenylate/guanylate cyclase domain-containing protein [Candidatus Ozemobacteraceae bacterium]|nr:adenylate/guanylate cyclase domain-containing protein [Candidatus Ozemobacteraceae bacterium]
MADEIGNETKVPSRITDILAFLGSIGIGALAYLVFTNKIPKLYGYVYNYFYVLAIVGVLGVMGERIATAFLAFFLPLLVGGATLALKYRPDRFPIEDWWEAYSVLVLFSAGFLYYLFFKWEAVKKLKGGDQGSLKARVDPNAAARYRDDQARKEAAKEGDLGGLAGKVEKEEKKLKGAREKAVAEQVDPNETAEQRMEREIRQIKDDFSKKSMKLSTTLLRIKNLSKSLDRDEIFTTMLEIVSKGLDASRVQLLLNDEAEGKLRVVRAEGMSAKEYKDLVIPHEENSIIAFLARSGGSEKAQGGALGVKECEIDPKTKGLVGQGVLKSVIAAPIYVENKVFGVLNVEKMQNPDYTRDDQNLLATCADVAGLVMKNAKLYSATMEDLVSTKKISEEQLRRNEELKGSLSRIVSPSVADMIMRDPSALKLGGSKCECTMFFSDIRGFTKMSEKMDPTAIVEQLNVYFTRMTDILMELDGTLDKYVGDELMALFGAPVSRPDDPIRAVLCGVKMLAALEELQKTWEREGRPIIQIGIGINTGEVTAGYMGSEKQLSYTVIGDNVNLAARVMANAKPMELLITKSVYDFVKEYFVTTPLEPIMVKGKSMPIDIYLVKGIRPGVDLGEIIGQGIGSLTLAGSEPAPHAAAAASARPGMLPPGMAGEELKQNVQIDGKPKVIECHNCGTENEMQTKFCTKCGMPIF